MRKNERKNERERENERENCFCVVCLVCLCVFRWEEVKEELFALPEFATVLKLDILQ